MYNNHGYMTIGLVVEQISGMPYSNFVRKRLLEPLGISRTNSTKRSCRSRHLAPLLRLRWARVCVREVLDQ